MPRNIDIALLRAFAAVVETGSVTRAARLLNLTQAAVSQQIKRLEELFGAELFERGKRSFRLTDAGERLIAHAHKLMALNDEVWGLMSAPDYDGEVRFGVPYDIVNPNIPPILRRFDRTWPRAKVTLVCGITVELLEQLANGELDLILTTEPDTPEGAELLLGDPLVWVGAADGDAHLRHPLPVSFGHEGCAFRAAAIRAVAEAYFQPRFARLRAWLGFLRKITRSASGSSSTTPPAWSQRCRRTARTFSSPKTTIGWFFNVLFGVR